MKILEINNDMISCFNEFENDILRLKQGCIDYFTLFLNDVILTCGDSISIHDRLNQLMR